MHYLVMIAAAAVAIFGLLITFRAYKVGKVIARDRFNRTNSSGVMEFDSYDDALKARGKERYNAVKVPVGFIMMLFGGGVFISAYFQGQENTAKAIASEGLRLERECDAVITGPKGGDLTPCHDLCQIDGYQNWCTKTFGRPDGPPRRSRGNDS